VAVSLEAEAEAEEQEEVGSMVIAAPAAATSAPPLPSHQHTLQMLPFQRKAFRAAFRRRARHVLNLVVEEAMGALDASCDAMGVKFVHDRLPPMLLREELPLVSAAARAGPGVSATAVPKQKVATITRDSRVRIVREGAARIMLQDGLVVLYHMGHNSRVHFANELPALEFDPADGPALETLLNTYPEYVKVGVLPLPELEDRIELADSLFQEGLLMVEDPHPVDEVAVEMASVTASMK
jgi:lysine-specific demethylase/histidyl-hydroxylase NO66